MAAGERYENGKPKDIVRHMLTWKSQYNLAAPREIVCGRKKFGYATDDLNDVTCKQCLKYLQRKREQNELLK